MNTDDHKIQNAPPLVTASESKAQKGKKRRPRWVKVVITILLILLVLLGGTAAFGYYYYETNIQGPLSKIIHPVSLGKDTPLQKPIPSDSNVAGKVWNILLLGSDNDGKFNFPNVLTQVMMIVHIDTIHNTVTLVSIPRDSWVYVPQVGGMHKIDQAFYLGASQHNNFDDGVRLAVLTVEKDYGIPIDRYAWVGLQGFVNVINTLGGVDIDVTHPIVDDAYPNDTGTNAQNPYGYKRLYLTPGPQHLDGEQALEYVRSRHADLIGDIGRTQRQQQILEALKQKLSLSTIIPKVPQLFSDLSGYVYTNISEQEMIGFAAFGRGFSTNNIHNVTLGPGPGSQDYGDFGTAYDPSVGSDQSVVFPHCQNIQPLINKIFGLGNAQSCNISG
jgi:LCP family protein required for cell wall assembly